MVALIDAADGVRGGLEGVRGDYRGQRGQRESEGVRAGEIGVLIVKFGVFTKSDHNGWRYDAYMWRHNRLQVAGTW